MNEKGNRNLPISEGIYARADPSSGISVCNMNDEFNLFGKKTYFQMTSLEHFAIINDAPVEKEVVKEKKGSLWGNLLSGLVIAVALGACAIALTAAALAAPVVATAAALGMGAAIFGGASLGALAVTVSATEADEKRGEARSWMQFMEGVIKGGLMGGMVGGSIYGLWTAAPIVGQALGLQLSMWVGSSTFTAITVPKIGVGAGYALMGLEGVRGLNEISSIGSGQNWILEQAFGGNEEAYTTTGMLLDLLSMGYMQVGMDNIALDRNRSQKETNIKEKASWVNTEADLDLPDIQIHKNVDTKEKNYEILTSDGETVYLSEGRSGALEGAGDISQLDKIKSGQLNITELLPEEQLKIAKQIQNNSPVSIPENVVPKIQRKNGYDQITYKWTDESYTYEVRWHTSTPNAPDGTLPNWRVDRKVPGFAGGKDPVTGAKIPGYPAINEVLISPPDVPSYYISIDVWEAATTAYLRGTTTEAQKEILRWGHITTD